MKTSLLYSSLLLTVLCFSNCSKDVDEPKHKADGRNLVFVRVDDTEEFLLTSKWKMFNKTTSSNLNDQDESNILRYSESNNTQGLSSNFYISFSAKNQNKSEFQGGRIQLIFNKSTQELDTSLFRKAIAAGAPSLIQFNVGGDNPRRFYVDSIIDYNLIKWDSKKETLTISANATYRLDNNVKPQNPKIYFYIDITY